MHIEGFDPLIQDILNTDIPMTLKRMGFTSASFTLPGFYKCGEVTLYKDGERWMVKDRYDKCTPIDSLQDLVELNFYWWKTSKNRGGWEEPDSHWVGELIKSGYIRKVERTVYEEA